MHTVTVSPKYQVVIPIKPLLRSDSCLSKELARYFGENREEKHCGHCSFCKSGKTIIPGATELKPLSDFDFEEAANEFIEVVGEHFSTLNLTKFLCGIYTPVFSKLKIKKLPYFGIFEKYSFPDVKNWINEYKISSDFAIK